MLRYTVLWDLQCELEERIGGLPDAILNICCGPTNTQPSGVL